MPTIGSGVSEDPVDHAVTAPGGVTPGAGSVAPAMSTKPSAPPGGSTPVPHGRDEARPTVGSRRAVATLTVAAAIVLLSDILTKHVAVATLSDRGPVEVIPGLLDLELTRNSGAAFSLAGGATVLLSLVALAVVAVVVFTARRLRSVGWALVLGALLGGAVGNLADRLFRAPGPLRGHVVDFVHLHYWPIFNVADSAIVCGGVLAVILSLRGVGLDGTRYAEHHPPGGGSDHHGR
ncbi:signal peptidase II [Frankia sp. BMG5.23]|uniref:signal peptidase II n=1 Tax=Frankia sp. BMG5.23 TaxID=683305 RepID=UPI0034CE8F90